MAGAVLPPRKLRQAEEVTIKRNRSSLELLMQTGFPKARAEKALAATGDQGVHLATDWLLSHAADPTLDLDIPRDYVLYLCPVGQLQQQLLSFWQSSYEACGWNRAHNYFPHITLCSFFKASDGVLSKMAHLSKTIGEQYASQLSQLDLDLFSSNNFIGLFVESEAADFLKKIVSEFSETVKRELGVEVEAHKKQLHISLAYQFRSQDRDTLENQVKGIKLELPVRWDLRLYSRDPRIANCQVHKVLFEHEPRFEDELRLIKNNFVWVSEEEVRNSPDAWVHGVSGLSGHGTPRFFKTSPVHKVLFEHEPRFEDELRLIKNDFVWVSEEEVRNSPDAWAHGVSWLSGCSGMFPLTYTERVAETETWTMHRSIPIIGTDIGIRAEEEPAAVNGPIEFDNPVYHEGGKKCAVTGAVVGPVNVLHFPASPKRCRKTQQPDNQPNTQPVAHTNSHTPNQAISTDSDEDVPELPPQRGSIKERKSPQQTVPNEPNDIAHSTANGVSTKTGSSRPTSVADSASAGVNQSRPVSNQLQRNQAKPVGSGPPLLVPRQNKPKESSEAGSAAGSSSSHAAAHNKQQSSQQPTTQHSLNHVTPAPNLIGSATMPINHASGGRSKPGGGASAAAGGGAMHTSAEPSLGAGGGARKSRGPRQLYVVRHGERIDFTFGKDWIRNSFDSGGNYIRYDLNMPKTLPKRKGGPKSYERDSPLTTQGHFQANLVGCALKDVDVPISHVYASPSLRCVQTANEIINGLGIQRPIHVEPGLFEWLGWYKGGLPSFMTGPELIEAGLPVNTSYEPVWPESRFDMEEKSEQYYDRCHEVTRAILQRHEDDGGNVLIVGHAASLDVCTRQLVGHPQRGHVDFNNVLCKVPYCSVAVAQEGVHVREAWYIIEPPILPFAHTNNPKYNWTILTTPLT